MIGRTLTNIPKFDRERESGLIEVFFRIRIDIFGGLNRPDIEIGLIEICFKSKKLSLVENVRDRFNKYRFDSALKTPNIKAGDKGSWANDQTRESTLLT